MAKQVFRGYCPACCNYLPMSRFITAQYFCRSCLARIRQALRKARLDWTGEHPDRLAISALVDQTVEAIQRERDGEYKKTCKVYEFDVKKWRTKKGKHGQKAK